MGDATKSWKRPIGKIHTVVAGETSSGIANITFVSNQNRGDEMIYSISVKDSTGKEKSNGVQHSYNSTSGVVALRNADTNLATGDIVNIIGMHYV